MTDVTLVDSTLGDVELLTTLMRDFYAESGFPLDASRARQAFEQLHRQPSLGKAYLVTRNGEIAGYLVLTLTFSMEYGGATAFLDDLYLKPGFRGEGVGTAALAQLMAIARGRYLCAIHLEVGRDNPAAQTLYRKVGFTDNDRQLLTLHLRDALHEEIYTAGSPDT